MSRHMLVALASLLSATALTAACVPAAPPRLAIEPTAAMPAGAPTAEQSESTASAKPERPDLVLATTTSTQDSGLLDVLIPLFEEQTGYKVKPVAVGSGQAIQMGQEGNADILFVHSPSAEKAFMADGFGKDRFLVMHNYFMIVGPASDPAGVRGAADASAALRKIYEAGAPFVSRGDDSGTHTKELSLWKAAGLDPATEIPAWYTESGQGMAATLTIASEKESYTLTDRGTFLATQSDLALEVLYAEDPALINVYHAITVNPGARPKVNYEGALAFARWLVDPEIQNLIGEFGVSEYGEPLFIPDADKTDADLGMH